MNIAFYLIALIVIAVVFVSISGIFPGIGEFLSLMARQTRSDLQEGEPEPKDETKGSYLDADWKILPSRKDRQ